MMAAADADLDAAGLGAAVGRELKTFERLATRRPGSGHDRRLDDHDRRIAELSRRVDAALEKRRPSEDTGRARAGFLVTPEVQKAILENIKWAVVAALALVFLWVWGIPGAVALIEAIGNALPAKAAP